jgi:hypothetical protein
MLVSGVRGFQMNRAVPLPRFVPVSSGEKTRGDDPRAVTLLELVCAVGAVTDDDREVVATVCYMLRSGRVRLAGNFRGTPVDEFC